VTGISREGNFAEKEFQRLTNAILLAHGAQADAWIRGHSFEIKTASANVLNQVRPIRFHTVIVWDTEQWYVIPAERVVEIAVEKKRGQHTENSLECCTLTLDQFQDCVVDAEKMREKAISVAERSSLLTELKAEMDLCMRESKTLASEQRHRVKKFFSTQATLF
jgi:hypothetical protein